MTGPRAVQCSAAQGVLINLAAGMWLGGAGNEGGAA